MTFKQETDIPIVDHPSSFGFTRRKVMMSPMQFIKLARMTSTDLENRSMSIAQYMKITRAEESVRKAYAGLKSSKPLVPTPYFEFKYGRIKDHEGRNRAYASMELNRKQIPVWFIWEKTDRTPPKNLSSIRPYWD